MSLVATLLRWLLLALAALTILLGATVGVFLNHPDSVDFVIDRVEALTDGRLAVGQRHGTLAGPLELGDVRWQGRQERVHVRELVLEWRPLRLLLGQLDVTRLHLQDVRLEHRDGDPVATARPDGAPPAAGLRLPVAVHLRDLSVGNLRLEHPDLPATAGDPLQLAARLRLQETRFRLFDARITHAAGEFDLSGRGDWQQWWFDLTAGTRFHSPWGRVDATLRAAGDDAMVLVDGHLTGPLDLSINGEVHTPVAAPELDLAVALRDVGPAPLAELPIPLLMSGEATVIGPIASLALDGHLEVDGGDWGLWNSRFGLRRTAPDTVELEDLRLRREDDPCRLDLGLQTRLVWGAEPRLDIPHARLQGRLHGHAITGRAMGHWTPETWSLSDIDIAAGANTARGALHQRGDDAGLSADARLELTDMEAVWPGLLGSASVEFAWDRDAGELSASIPTLRHPWGHLDDARVDARLDHERLAARLRIDELGGAGHMTRDIALDMAGSPETVDWQLALTEPDLELAGELGWHDAPWLTLTDGRWSHDHGIWRITLPLRLDGEGEEWVLHEGCAALESGGELCLAGERDASGYAARSHLHGLELPPLLAPHLADTTMEQGVLDGRAELLWREDEQSLSGELNARDAHWRQPLPDDLPVTAQLALVTLGIEYGHDTGLATRLDLAARNPPGRLRAVAAFPDWHPGTPLGASSMTGHLGGSIEQVAWLGALAPGFIRTTGRLEADLDLQGSLEEPRYRGGLGWHDGSLEAPEIGLALEGVTLELSAPEWGVPLRLDGHARAGGGPLRVEGTLESPWPPRLELTVTGEEARLVHLPEAEVFASPTLDLSVRPGAVSLGGEVAIGRATFELPERTGVIQPSRDVIRQEEVDAAVPGTTIEADVRVLLGQRVRLRGYGFEGRLEGDLRIIELPGAPPVGRGELIVRDGRYRAWGQNLAVNEGRLLFADSPLDNPGLDIRAVRHGIPVTAGVHIIGRARNPQLVLFSDPAMDDTDILSWIVLGRPISQSGAGDGAQLAQAALALQLAGGGRLARNIGDRFGIDEVGVEAGTAPDTAALVLGTWLSPRLYLRYAIGVTEDINTLRASYLLTESWSLETETGPESGVDLMFSIDR